MIEGERPTRAPGARNKLSDLLRYQNMLCRYDTMALKSLDMFSIHGFPVGYVQFESNLLGIRNGNGSRCRLWRLDQHHREVHEGEALLHEPFEVRLRRKRKNAVPN